MTTVTDFYRSYMCWGIEPNLEDTRLPGHMKWRNEVRIRIDARCTITNDATGTSEEFYLVAPCRTEWMYRDTGVIQNPSGEYRVIFSDDRQLYVGKSIHESVLRHGPSSPTSGFNYVKFKITENDAELLADEAAIVAESRDGIRPIIAKTEIINADRGLRATLEYPVHTMNYNDERTRFQVDTGPLIFPDLDVEAEHLIDTLSLAHAVYNKLDYVEFVLKRPTPVEIDGQTVTTIYHYSDFRNLNANTTFYAAN
jgi:hypothetical protein